MKKKVLSICFAFLLLIVLLISLILGISKSNIMKAHDKSDYDNWLNNKTSFEVKNNLILYKKLKNRQNINVLLLGDDLALSKGKSDAHPGWSNLLVSYIEASFKNKVYLESLAQPGDTILEGEKIVTSNPNLENFDLIIICFGKNDSTNKIPLSTFQKNYSDLIESLKSKNSTCTILTIIPSTLPESSNYRHEIENLNSDYNLKCIDMLEQFKTSKVEMATLSTNDFPNDNGYNLYAVSINDTIIKEVSNLK
ncbi:SGNH/GDSL hydrolase family protein [Clostridium saccharoperbutylacetonicum]|uniref:SGNH/GDSL hydrolase family protein n=1 Tax=Clostridium saccharoperbutylacetonicum TaxID=36745 RepID=UPI0039EC34F7